MSFDENDLCDLNGDQICPSCERFDRDHIHHANSALFEFLLRSTRPQHPAVIEGLKRQRANLEHAGPVTGHEGGVTALSFNRER